MMDFLKCGVLVTAVHILLFFNHRVYVGGLQEITHITFFSFSAILQGHLKRSPLEVKQALYQMDESVLTPELLRQMLAYTPDSTEVIIARH